MLLIHLEGIVGDYVPGICALNEGWLLGARLEVAVDEDGFDNLSAELLLAMAIGAAE